MHLHRSIAGEGGKWHLALATEQHLLSFAICFFFSLIYAVVGMLLHNGVHYVISTLASHGQLHTNGNTSCHVDNLMPHR